MNRDKAYFIARLFTTIASAILFSILLSINGYAPVNVRHEGTIYWSFSGLFIVFFIFSGAIYMIGGLPCSLLADAAVRKMKPDSWLAFCLRTLLYGFAGFILTILFQIVNGSSGDIGAISKFSLLGVIAALLFLYISLIADWIAERARAKRDSNLR